MKVKFIVMRINYQVKWYNYVKVRVESTEMAFKYPIGGPGNKNDLNICQRNAFVPNCTISDHKPDIGGEEFPGVEDNHCKGSCDTEFSPHGKHCSNDNVCKKKMKCYTSMKSNVMNVGRLSWWTDNFLVSVAIWNVYPQNPIFYPKISWWATQNQDKAIHHLFHSLQVSLKISVSG